MKKTGFLIGTLGALALGVFCSCSSDDVSDPYAQDRNISAIDLPEIDSLVLDSIQKGLYPDTLSGWELHWSQPYDSSGTRLYILRDSMKESDLVQKLQNGSGDFDFAGAGLGQPIVSLPVHDTVWRIPSRLFEGKGHTGKGRDLRTDTAYWFAVWVRYADGAVGAPVRYRFYLGDEFPPEIPLIDTVVGQTFFQMEFDRPKDVNSRFDESFSGRIDSIRAIWWKGTHLTDSVRTETSHPDTLHVPQSQLRDTSVHRFRMLLENMPYETSHLVLLQFFDSAGNRSTLGPFPVRTRDDRLPAPPRDGVVEAASYNAATIRWSPATDSFADGQYVYGKPNHRIGGYRILASVPIGAPFRALDSLDVGSDSASFVAGGSWPPTGQASRFAWNGSRWTWSWPNFTPGDSFRIAVLVWDRSGNPAAESLFIKGVTKPVQGVACPSGKPVVPITGTDSLGAFCMERFEHVSNGKVSHDATWAEAKDACAADGGFLCSEAQWQRACETEPGSSAIHGYGALEVGADDAIDSAVWLQEVCGVATGKSDSSAALDTALRDPRCVSAWGLRDMPGMMTEWTRDVWFSRPDSIRGAQRDPWSRAYLDTSDYTRKADHGTLRGGSWLDLKDLSLSKSLARCRSRTYAAYSSYDTLPDKRIVRTPNPDGRARSFGFRCCYKPL